MSIDEARRILSDLEATLAESDRRAVELETEATRISLPAMTGDGAARKRLDVLNRERHTQELEGRNIKSAIRAQEALIAEAERAAIAAGEVEKAKRALAIAAGIEGRGKRLDAALMALAVEAENLENDLADLNYSLGFVSPSVAHLRAIVERPFFAALMFQPSGRLKGNGQPAEGTLKLRHLAPGERMTFSEITEGYAKTIRRTAGLVLGDKSEEAA